MCARDNVAAKPPCEPRPAACRGSRGEAASCRGKAACGEAAYNLVSILIVVRTTYVPRCVCPRHTMSRQSRARRSRLASQGPRLAAGHAAAALRAKASRGPRGEAASCRGKAARGEAAYNLVSYNLRDQHPFVRDVRLTTSRTLTSGFDIWPHFYRALANWRAIL